MRSYKGKILLLMVVWVGFGGVCALAGGGSMTAKESRARALELVDKYAETQDKLRSSFISKSKTTNKFKGFIHERPALKKDKLYKTNLKLELRSDGNRHYGSHKTWGDRFGMHTTTEEHACHGYNLWDMNTLYDYNYHPDTPADWPDKNGSAYLTPKNKLGTSTSNSNIWTSVYGRPGRGFFYGGNVRIDSEMREAETISLQPEREEINGSECYVINAKAKGCRYKIWIDPKHNYHIAQAIVERDWWSFSRPEGYSKKPTPGKSRTVLKNVRFKKVGDVWLPAEFDYTLNKNTVRGDYFQSHCHHKITKFMINPDHDALRSFEPAFIKNGAMVRIKGLDGIVYTWQDGKLVDENGKKVDLDKLKVRKRK